MKNKMIKLAGFVAVAAALAQTAHATLLSGNIGFTGLAVLNTSDATTASTVTTWEGPGTTGNPIAVDDGVLSTLIPVGTQVALFSPWNFTSVAPIASFWSIDGVTFALNTWTLTYSATSVTISGLGTITAAGYGPTSYNFGLTFQDPSAIKPASFTFSASQAPVPDGGTTVMLLGAALSGLALVKRKLTA